MAEHADSAPSGRSSMARMRTVIVLPTPLRILCRLTSETVNHAAELKVWAKRQRDLAAAARRLRCRLHAVFCELVPGGVPKKIIAAHAARLLESVTAPDAVAAARWELAAAPVEDLHLIDGQLRETRKKLDTAVRASGTSLFGVGPVSAAIIIGDVRDVSRFAGRNQFAAYYGTAPDRGPPPFDVIALD